MSRWHREDCYIDRTYTFPRIIHKPTSKTLLECPENTKDADIWWLLREMERVYLDGWREGRREKESEILSAIFQVCDQKPKI